MNSSLTPTVNQLPNSSSLCNNLQNSSFLELDSRIKKIETNRHIPVNNYTSPSEEYRLKMKIVGLKESVGKNYQEICNDDLNQIKDIFNFLNLSDIAITDLRRWGKFIQGKSRPIFIKLINIWDVRKLLHASRLPKDYTQATVLIFPDLSDQDKCKKRILLRKRYDLISNGTAKDRIKLRNLKFFVDDVEVNVVEA